MEGIAVDNPVVRDDVVLRRDLVGGASRIGRLRGIIKFIACLTLVSGLVQMATPQVVLRLVGALHDATTNHFFAIIGMFMTLFGGMLLQALTRSPEQSVAVFWAGLQKFGASVAVGLGIMRHVFSPIASAIVLVDFLSGALILWYWSVTRDPAR